MNLKIKLAALSFISILITSGNLSAKPGFANKLQVNCVFCHIGAMGSKNFTKDGLDYCKFLKSTGAIAPSKPTGTCTVKRLQVFDNQGNSLGVHSLCIADMTPASC